MPKPANPKPATEPDVGAVEAVDEPPTPAKPIDPIDPEVVDPDQQRERYDAARARHDEAFERYHQLHGDPEGADELLAEIAVATDLMRVSRNALEAALEAQAPAELAKFATFKAWTKSLADAANKKAGDAKKDSDDAHAAAPKPPKKHERDDTHKEAPKVRS